MHEHCDGVLNMVMAMAWRQQAVPMTVVMAIVMAMGVTMGMAIVMAMGVTMGMAMVVAIVIFDVTLAMRWP